MNTLAYAIQKIDLTEIESVLLSEGRILHVSSEVNFKYGGIQVHCVHIARAQPCCLFKGKWLSFGFNVSGESIKGFVALCKKVFIL